MIAVTLVALMVTSALVLAIMWIEPRMLGSSAVQGDRGPEGALGPLDDALDRLDERAPAPTDRDTVSSPPDRHARHAA